MTELSDQIITDAAKPKAVTNGDVSTTRRDIKDQIAAVEFAEQRTAAASPFAVLRQNTVRAVPPGTAE